jgi:methyltransferase (TIGR00027 family)
MIIENVSDTARWVAVYRAMETERPDALFRDPYARKLAGERGFEILKSLPRARGAAWAMIVRTAVMDEIIMERVQSGQIDMVVNLAAGLDARPWRLDLPNSLKWVDVDFAPILQYKAAIIGDAKPRCFYTPLFADLTNAAERKTVFAKLASECQRALVVTEGLLIYLSPENVGALAADLYAAERFEWWLSDLGSPRLLRIMQRSWGKAANAGNAPFLFAPAEGTAFFQKFGWKEKINRYSMEEARRLNRQMPGAAVMRIVGRVFPKRMRQEFQRMSSIILLERAWP